MSDGQDRRKYQRICESFEVTLSKFQFPLEKQKRIHLECKNISAGGLLLESAEQFSEGDNVQITIHIPSLNKHHPGFFKVFESDSEQNLVAVAQIARCQRRETDGINEIGIAFVDVYEDDWKALYNLIMKKIE